MEPKYMINEDGEFVEVRCFSTNEPLICSDDDYEWLNTWLEEDDYEDEQFNY